MGNATFNTGNRREIMRRGKELLEPQRIKDRIEAVNYRELRRRLHAAELERSTALLSTSLNNLRERDNENLYSNPA